MESMNLLEVRGNFLLVRSNDSKKEAFIGECATQGEFDSWRSVWPDEQLALRFQNTIYVKVPLRLDECGEFCLDYDVLPLAEANALISLWNERYKKWLVV